MTRMLLAGVFACFLVIALGPPMIAWLRRREFGQNVREDGPSSHVATKSGTPTMGGLLILFGLTVPFWAIGIGDPLPGEDRSLRVDLLGREHTMFGVVAWTTMMMCALIGLWDDLMKVVNKRSLGLSGRWKLLLLGLVTAWLGWSSTELLGMGTVIEVPFTELPPVQLGWGWYVLLFFVLAGAANTVNLTDGLDGLAATTVVLALSAFTAIAFIVRDRDLGNEWPLTLGGSGALDVAVLCAALGGALIGFLWWNAYPAQVFMGDTGSLALGGALAAIAVMLKAELLLAIIGGLFVVEGLSVMLQSAVFKATRRISGTPRRLFLMAPIHHHFELKNWSETQIMVRFAIVASMFSATGFTVWFRTH